MQNWKVPGSILLGLALSIIIAKLMPEQTALPVSITENFQIVTWINDVETWLKDNYQHITRKISGFIGVGLGWLEAFL